MKMIARNRDERYQTANELIADLEEYLAQHNVRSLTSNLGARSQAVPGAAGIATMQVTPAGVATDLMTPAPAPASVAAAAQTPAAPTLRAAVTAPDLPIAAAANTAPNAVAYTPPVAAPQAASYVAPPPRSSNKSTFAVLAIVIALLVVAGGAAGLGFIGYRYLKGHGMLGGGTAQEAAMVQAKQPAKAAPDSTHPVDPANVELSNPKVDPLNAANAQSQPSQAGQAGQQPSSSPVAAKSAPAQPAAQMTVNGSRTQPVSAPVKVARVERLQQVESSPASAPARHSSRVVVSVQGEAGLNASVARVVTSELESAGLDVVVANDLPSMEGLGSHPSTSALIDRLRGQAGVLVVARIEATGERELHFYGRTDTAYGSRVTLTAYDVASAQPLGTRASASLEYTHLNADGKAEEAVTPLATQIARAIRSR
jgi:hypothetical protein